MTGAGGHTGRGYRAAARGLRTWWRMLCLAVALSLIGAAGAAGWKTWRATTSYEWYSVGMLALAETLIHAGVSPHRAKDVRHSDGRTYTVTLGAIADHEPLLALRRRMIAELLDAALLGFGTAAGIVVAALAALRYMGGRLKRGRRLRGGELVSARQLRRRTAPPRLRVPWRPARPPGRPYRIAGVPWPQGAETRHTVVSGTTGAGKTVLIADLVEQIRARGERCVLYDKMGSYTETFFDPVRDTLLNPLDARAPRWSPFLEARNARDFDTMAAALIPRQKDTVDPFWITAARQLFSHGAAVFRERGETRNRVLVEHLLKTSLDALAEAMEGTVAQSIVDPANPKTALSVRAMLTANIGALELLPDEGNPFSIRDWIETGEDGFLFLTSRGDQHASLRGLISTWLEIAVNALLSLPRDDGRRVWVILDELPTLHQVPSLQPGLAESRQFGGCFVLGVQVFSALRDLYGRGRGGDDLGALRHAGGAGGAGPGHGGVVGGEPGACGGGGTGGERVLRRGDPARRGDAGRPAGAAAAGAAGGDRPAGQPRGLPQVPRLPPGRADRAALPQASQGRGAVRGAGRTGRARPSGGDTGCGAAGPDG